MSARLLEMTVTGGDPSAAAAMFKDAGSAVRSKIRAAAVALAEDVRDAARSLAPRRTGKLAASIQVKVIETPSELTVTTRPGKHYALFIEGGVVNHGSARNASSVSGSKIQMARGLNKIRALGQWRVPPHPFMGPASAKVLGVVGSQLQEAVAAGIAEAQR